MRRTETPVGYNGPQRRAWWRGWHDGYAGHPQTSSRKFREEAIAGWKAGNEARQRGRQLDLQLAQLAGGGDTCR